MSEEKGYCVETWSAVTAFFRFDLALDCAIRARRLLREHSEMQAGLGIFEDISQIQSSAENAYFSAIDGKDAASRTYTAIDTLSNLAPDFRAGSRPTLAERHLDGARHLEAANALLEAARHLETEAERLHSASAAAWRENPPPRNGLMLKKA